MTDVVTDTKWLVPCGGLGSSLIIHGWYPAAFDWDITTLHTRQAQLRKLKIVFNLRPGNIAGTQPDILFDQLPIPIFSNDSNVIDIFTHYWDGFATIPVVTGCIQRGRFVKGGRSFIIVPLPEVIYPSPEEVPVERQLAVIDRRFCVTSALVQHHAFSFSDVQFTPFGDSAVLPSPTTPDFSVAFVKRVNMPEAEVEERIVRFVLASLQRYQRQYAEKLTGLLLDCDPHYGYIIVALKQTPFTATADTDIGEFEFDRFAVLDAAELYGNAGYLSAPRLRAMLIRVIERLAQQACIQALAAPAALHMGYAFHDESMRWLADILPGA